MNITEFAERIVFGTSLDEKLLIPGKLSFETGRARPKVDGLFTPGRPVGLEMRHDRGSNAQPPSDDQLENENARGQLLHFLANHELLATELMALVLLKFPDAPAAFRQGILVTLQEEQEHTRMYLKRMRECGVEFGSFPLSGQFWRMVEPMQSPMDFVSRLSLTFEQANLDYSFHFSSVFGKLGDAATAQLLQKIYEDEIGHVRHGLHWFRKWKNPAQSDWEAYQATLEYPMSPQRAMGARGMFNRDGREQAGLTTDFINTIEVFRESRGRSPTVRWFDPAAEAELAGEMTMREMSSLEQLGKDLELVMVSLAKQDDLVLVRRMPSQTFRKHLIDVGFDLPQFLTFEERATIGARKLHNFSPWAWTPKNHEIARPLIASAHLAPPVWREDWRDLYRKSWSASRLREWLIESEQAGDCPDWFTSVDTAGVVVIDLPETSAKLAALSAQGYRSALIKADLGTAGRGQERVDLRTKGVFDRQAGSVSHDSRLSLRESSVLDSSVLLSRQAEGVPHVVEPELDRLMDLSFLWFLPRDAESPKFLGWTRPLVTAGRRYAGTRLGAHKFDGDDRIKRFLLADRAARLKQVADWLQPRLTNELLARKFSGYFGVDALVCQDTHEQLKIKPLVEMNPRTTMGHMALRLEKRLASGVTAEFKIFTRAQWLSVAEKLAEVPFEKANDGRWKSGVVRLGEVDHKTKLMPVLLVGDCCAS